MKLLVIFSVLTLPLLAQYTPPSGGGGGSVSLTGGTGISVAPNPITGTGVITNTSPGASPAGSAVTDAQCWASSTTFGVCTSPAFFSPTVNTQSANDNSTKAASTAYVDATKCTTTITSGGTSFTLSTCFTVNQHATAGIAILYTLPTAASGLQYCIDNGWNGSAADTGVLTLSTSASGQFLVFTDGTLTASGGNVASGGAARDGACVYGIDSTHWMFLPHSGTWSKN